MIAQIKYKIHELLWKQFQSRTPDSAWIEGHAYMNLFYPLDEITNDNLTSTTIMCDTYFQNLMNTLNILL
jgi:hypothetical protein